jgi:multiple sugar transport system ATP-binding protein
LSTPFGLLDASRTAQPLGSGVVCGIRPEDVHLGTSESPSAWQAEGTVVLVEPNGPLRTVHIDLGGKVILVSCRSDQRPDLHSRVSIRSAPECIHIFSGIEGVRAGTAAELGVAVKGRVLVR